MVISKITYKIYNNINQINPQDWEAVFGNIPEGYAFYKALGDSELNEFTFSYLVVYQDDTLAAIAPLFSADFNLDIAVEGALSKIINLIRRVFPRFLIMKTLFCGSPFGEHGVLGIRKIFRNDPELLRQLQAGIKELASKLNTPLIIFKDFLGDSCALLDPLTNRGFIKLESFPSVQVELGFSSFEEYLKSLGPSTRKSLGKKLKQAYAEGQIEVKIIDKINGQIDQIFELYENAYHGGSTKFERLTKKFFLRIAEEMPGQTRFFLYYVNGSLAAFNLCFVYQDLLIDKFIGFNYDISSRYHLYFVSWAYNIRWCIEHSLRYYYPGQTDYEPKIRLGGKIIPLYAYLKHKNILMNALLKVMALLLKPDNFDADIRK